MGLYFSLTNLIIVVFGLKTGHIFCLHFFGISDNPLHDPSKHFRFFTLRPVPHDFEHDDHSVHSLQIPFIPYPRPLIGRETLLSFELQGLSGHFFSWTFVPGHEPFEKSDKIEGALSVRENLFSYLSAIIPSHRR